MRTQSAKRREQILQISAEVFAQKGYHRARVSDIVDGAEVARGTFYLYFTGKQEVFEVLLERFLSELTACVRPIEVDDSEPPPLMQLLDNLVRAIKTVRRFSEVAVLVLGSIEAPDRDVRAQVEEFFDALKALVKRSIEQGMALGLVRQVPEDVATHFVFGAAREVMRELVALRPDGATDLDPAQLALHLVDLVAAGLLVPDLAQAPELLQRVVEDNR